MVRFRCIHCGASIAVHERYMDRLACCPECGGMTHPLAEHLVKAGEISVAAGGAHSSGRAATNSPDAAPADSTREVHCDNCGVPIGKLQTAHPWDGHPVCAACYRKLSMEKTRPAPEAVQQPVAKLAPEVPAQTQPASTSDAEPPPATPTQVVAARAIVRAPGGAASMMARPAPSAEKPGLMERISEFAWNMRGKIIGLCALLVALYLIVSIIESLKFFLLCTGGIIAVIAIFYWIRRGVIAVRRRFAS